MENRSRLQVKFWGVRGSIATPAPQNLNYGGNTTCLEIRSPGGLLVIDTGTGVRDLGIALMNESGKQPLSIPVLYTHFHWDHIQGLPFFQPAYSPVNEIVFFASRPPEEIDGFLGGQMSTPYFPVDFQLLSAKKNFHSVRSDAFKHNGFHIHPFPMNHPQGATGYRIEQDGAVIVHACDFEPGHEKLDSVLREHAQNANILILDSQYTPDEYESKRGWGHSTWLEGTKIARDANVEQLILTHHDPAHDDKTMDEILPCARRYFENTFIAKEGWTAAVLER